MHKLVTTALAVAMGLAWSTLPAIAADPSKDQSTTDKVKEKAAETWDKTKEKTSGAWDKTKEKTVETKDKVKDKLSGNKKESAEDKAEAARKADGKDTVGAKVDRGLDKTKAKARETKDKIAAKTESSDEVRQAQTALKEKGQDPGPIDGIHGPRTSAALRSYQKAENIKVTGRLDSETKAHLMGGQASSTTATPSASPTTGQTPAPPAATGSPSAPPQAPEKTQTK
jgi:hypothetical protein